MEEKKAQWIPWEAFRQLALIVEHERLHEVAKEKAKRLYNIACDVAINTTFIDDGFELPDGVLKRMPKVEATEKDREEFLNETKTVKYQRWLIEVNDLLEQLETQKDAAQDLWMMADSEFKGWQVKTKENRWYHSDMAMKEVYSHLDSAIFFLKILKGEDK